MCGMQCLLCIITRGCAGSCNNVRDAKSHTPGDSETPPDSLYSPAFFQPSTILAGSIILAGLSIQRTGA